MSFTDNPRGVIGNNSPDAVDYAKLEIERLAVDYADLANTADQLIADAEQVPDEIDDEHKPIVVSLIKRIRDATKRVDGLRELEKQPHFRRGQGVDQFFFGLVDRLARRTPRANEGAGDRLGRILTAHDNRKLAEEQERRRLAAEEAARQERIAREAREKLEHEAEQRRLEAERARAPAKIEEKGEVAAQAEQTASAAVVEHAVASDRAEAAYIDTLAKPADIMRTRGTDGTLSTMGKVGYAEITDEALLDKEKLWSFIPFAAKETALRVWAKQKDYREEMPGASVGKRNKSMVR